MTDVSFLTSLISGGLAGTAVDVSLFPLDTIKTRLQSRQGFLAAGGFRNIYSGESERREVVLSDWILDRPGTRSCGLRS